MTRLLSESDQATIAEHVALAERSTAGEIVVSVAEKSSAYGRERLAVSVACSMGVSALVHVVLPAVPAIWAICGQAPLLVVLFWLTELPWLLRLIVPEAAQRQAVNARAKQLFVEHGVTETKQRSGVLLYVSEVEHSIELLADRGIHERVGTERWEQLVKSLVNAIHDGHAAAGITAVVDTIGRLLAEHFPRSADDVNELPDAPFIAPRLS